MDSEKQTGKDRFPIQFWYIHMVLQSFLFFVQTDAADGKIVDAVCEANDSQERFLLHKHAIFFKITEFANSVQELHGLVLGQTLRIFAFHLT